VQKKSEKLLFLGCHSPDYLRERKITDDHRIVEEKLGIRIEGEPLEVLLDLYRSISRCESERQSELKELARQLIEGSVRSERRRPGQPELEQAVSLYLAISQLAGEHGANAVTIVCREFIRNETLPVPCLALTLLQDRGIPAACQGDLDALLTMILFQRVSGRPSCMGNPYQEDDTVVVSHCVMSRRMMGFDKEPQPYYLADYHGKKASVTVHTDVPKAEVVTFGRFTKNLHSLILGVGEVVDSFDREGRCRNGLKITVNDMEKLMDVRLDHQYHFAVVVGDHRARLTECAEEAEARLIEV
jgi:L-fucose isomerase-like protein